MMTIAKNPPEANPNGLSAAVSATYIRKMPSFQEVVCVWSASYSRLEPDLAVAVSAKGLLELGLRAIFDGLDYSLPAKASKPIAPKPYDFRGLSNKIPRPNPLALSYLFSAIWHRKKSLFSAKG
jgi:hypothetical protein